MSAVRAPSEYANEVRSEMSSRLVSSGRQNAGILREQLDRAGNEVLFPATICLGAIDCISPRDGGALSAAVAAGFHSLAFAVLTGVAVASETSSAESPPTLWLTLNAADGLFSLAHSTLLDAADGGGWGTERAAAALAALDGASLAAAEATGVTLAAMPSGRRSALEDSILSSNRVPALAAAGRIAGLAAGITGEGSLSSLAAWARALGKASVAAADSSGLPSSVRNAIDGQSGAGLPRESEEALLRFAGAVLEEGPS
jgi:hypothetical protein